MWRAGTWGRVALVLAVLRLGVAIGLVLVQDEFRAPGERTRRKD